MLSARQPLRNSRLPRPCHQAHYEDLRSGDHRNRNGRRNRWPTRLRNSGRKILLLERGDYLPSEPENWSPEAVFAQTRYKPKEQWFDEHGHPFSPGVHYFVGGNTKVYGAALPRLRKEDFSDLEHEEGVSPAWPVSYEEFEPYYCRAEQMLSVHGETGADPTDPPRSAPFPFSGSASRARISRTSKRAWNGRACTPIFCRWESICDQAEDASAARPATGFLARSMRSQRPTFLASARRLNRATLNL